jgi:group I intron endonuclease
MFRCNRHENLHLQNAWNKYGGDKFEFVIIHQFKPNVNVETVLVEEQKLLDEHYGKEYCYNQSSTARMDNEEVRKLLSKKMMGQKNPMFGKTHSEEARRKISESAKKRRWSVEQKKKIGEWAKGRTHSEETKQKLRVLNIGRKHTAETISRLKVIHKNRKRNPKVFFVFNHNQFGTHLLSTQEFINQFGLSISTIWKLDNQLPVDSKGWTITERLSFEQAKARRQIPVNETR